MNQVSCRFHFPAAGGREGNLRLVAPDDRGEAGAEAAHKALFHAAWEKNAFIAEALERQQPAPALLCDADVDLSPELRRRMEALLAKCPERGILYGLAGRRLCQRVPGVGVPSIRLERHRSVIGYVQFTKENDPGPWRTEARAWGGEHDDWRVYEQFGPERSVALPFGCYHVGGVRRHWGGFEGRLVGGMAQDGVSVGMAGLFGRNAAIPAAVPQCLRPAEGSRESAGPMWQAGRTAERQAGGAALQAAALDRPVSINEPLEGARVVFLADGGTDHALELLRSVRGIEQLLIVDAWELNQLHVERVEDLPIRLTGIAGWLPGKWEECRRRMLRGEAALPLGECVNPLFVDLIRWDREYTRGRFLGGVFRVQGWLENQDSACSPVSGSGFRQTKEDVGVGEGLTIDEQGFLIFEGAQGVRDGAVGRMPTAAGGTPAPPRKVRILGEGGADPLTQVEDGGVDVVWLGGEIGYTPLLQDVPRWRGKFPVVSWPGHPARADGSGECSGLEARATGSAGLVCGAFHDVWAWPESTACVEMLLGTPEVVTAGGEWLKRVVRPGRPDCREEESRPGFTTFLQGRDGLAAYPLPIPLEKPERTVPATREYGIVFYQNDRGEGTVEGLMLSLHSLRKHWQGEMAVLFSGEESPSVRMACARYGALYREVPEPEVEGDPRVVRRVFVDPEQQVREWGPYKKVLWVESGLIGKEKEFEKWGRKVGSGGATLHRVSEMTEAESRRMPPPERVERMRRDPALEARQVERRAALEVEVMLAWAATARVRFDTTVVIGLLPEDLAGFEKNWTATRWRHAAMTLEEEPRIHEPVPVLLGLCGVMEEEVRHAMRHRAALQEPEPWPDLVDKDGKPVTKPGPKESCASVGYFEVGGRAGSPHPEDEEQPLQEPHWTQVMAEAAERAQTEWLIYLDPMMHPSPGAELFLPHRLPGWGTEEKEKLVYAPGWAFRKIGAVEAEWIGRVFRAQFSDCSGAIPEDLLEGQILKHLRLGPSATMIRTDLMRGAYAEWRSAFTDIPFEIFLTLRLRRDIPPDPNAPPPPTQPPAPDSGKDPVPVMISSPAGMAVCRPQDWGWNT